ncbi:MAG: uracil-DNA glycosylase [Pseudomonadota bacterium]
MSNYTKATAAEPASNCPKCPRLAAFRAANKAAHPTFFNAPVPTWYPQTGAGAARLLVVGLAPGLKGANATGRPFTGDFAGDLLYETLVTHAFAEGRYEADPSDTLKLTDCAITNSVRCVPPQNKPVAAEVNTCRTFLDGTIKALPNLQVFVTLGKIAHDSLTRTLGERVAANPFGHNREHTMGRYTVISSYHCSRYNTNTGVLTPEMFNDVFARARATLATLPPVLPRGQETAI